jgi:hypothetical protein
MLLRVGVLGSNPVPNHTHSLSLRGVRFSMCIGLKLRLRRFRYWTHSGHQHCNRSSATGQENRHRRREPQWHALRRRARIPPRRKQARRYYRFRCARCVAPSVETWPPRSGPRRWRHPRTDSWLVARRKRSAPRHPGRQSRTGGHPAAPQIELARVARLDRQIHSKSRRHPTAGPNR